MNKRTPYGVIHYGECRDDWPNLRIYDQPPEGSSPVKLQGPAMRAFKAAEERYGKRTKRPKKWRRISLTGSWRSRAYQKAMHALYPKRFASECGGLHPDGLAIDVDTEQPNQGIIGQCLRAEGWVQVRPYDEPWHFSYVERG